MLLEKSCSKKRFKVNIVWILLGISSVSPITQIQLLFKVRTHTKINYTIDIMSK